jgi:hypothetical protein
MIEVSRLKDVNAAELFPWFPQGTVGRRDVSERYLPNKLKRKATARSTDSTKRLALHRSVL